MLDSLYWLLIVASLIYVFAAPRKEIPLVIVLHGLLQYGMTLAGWTFRLGSLLGSILVSFLFLSSFLLIWARSLNYSKEYHSIRLFFSLAQWTVLIGLLGFIGWDSPYYYLLPSSTLIPGIEAHQLVIHPAVKFGGNFLVFAAFFHLILHWGQKWTPVKTLIDLGPIILYLLLTTGLSYFLSTQTTFPIT